MRYVELFTTDDIKNEIERMKREYKGLSKLFIPDSRESTARGTIVVKVYRNMDPVMKVEAGEEILTAFIETLEEEKSASPKI